MLSIDSCQTNTKPVIGEERMLARCAESFLIYVSLRLAVENFPVEHSVGGVHFQKRGRKWARYVIKIRVEIEVTFIHHTFEDIWYAFLANSRNSQICRHAGTAMETENILQSIISSQGWSSGVPGL